MVTRLTLILALLFSKAVLAEEVQLNPDHPNVYTVVKNDTLWDIAAKFLKHPWQWTQLWRLNTQIKNPHLIYPNDTLRLVMVNGEPQLSLSRRESVVTVETASDKTCLFVEGQEQRRFDFTQKNNSKLTPCIRESEIEQPVRMIPLTAISAHLSSPKVVDETELAQAPHLVDFSGEHLIVGAGDRIYVRAIQQDIHHAYTVYRAGMPYVDPQTKEILGYEATYIANARLDKTGDPATLTVTKSASELLMGDRLMPTEEESLTLDYFPRPPERAVEGSIISVLGGVNQVGRYNVVVINKGTHDGMLVGHELTIYQQGRRVRDMYSVVKNDEVSLPDEMAGTLMVFRPFEKVSYALVMKASLPIHVSDKVRSE